MCLERMFKISKSGFSFVRTSANCSDDVTHVILIPSIDNISLNKPALHVDPFPHNDSEWWPGYL